MIYGYCLSIFDIPPDAIALTRYKQPFTKQFSIENRPYGKARGKSEEGLGDFTFL